MAGPYDPVEMIEGAVGALRRPDVDQQARRGLALGGALSSGGCNRLPLAQRVCLARGRQDALAALQVGMEPGFNLWSETVAFAAQSQPVPPPTGSLGGLRLKVGSSANSVEKLAEILAFGGGYRSNADLDQGRWEPGYDPMPTRTSDTSRSAECHGRT